MIDNQKMKYFGYLLKLNQFKMQRLIFLLGSIGLVFFGCSGGIVQRIDDPKRLPPAPARQGFLRLPDGPDEMRIYVDGSFRGRASDYSRGALLIPAGTRRIRITAQGYAPIYALVQISPHTPVELEGSLLPIEPAPFDPRSGLINEPLH